MDSLHGGAESARAAASDSDRAASSDDARVVGSDKVHVVGRENVHVVGGEDVRAVGREDVRAVGRGGVRDEGGRPSRRLRIEADREAVERDLSRLVLTLVELIRQLVERQCIRRMEQGDLSDEQVEVLGLTLMRLEEAMTELCERFDLSPSDLNIDLGPLGPLLPRE
ncbi:gas vesicle protein K [Nonomuraea sp. SYSU D8015]|uniref:gas vesicle protein K n=1 Tax=Nonomuraea sp. SYSU D8015 TaxID=2593644 RepID=UPI001CB73430|nr:gas vesicle protein K [Nonomuraea sp. SYSU D8015]